MTTVRLLALWLICGASSITFAQPFKYTPSSVSGQIQLTAVTNLAELSAGAATMAAQALFSPLESRSKHKQAANIETKTIPLLRPPEVIRKAVRKHLLPSFGQSVANSLIAPRLSVGPTSSFGFPGLTHTDQRNANNGNQFSVEPPNPSIAVADGFVLEGVNNAVQVFSTKGTPLTNPVSSNQVFGLGPAIDRVTGFNGVFPTDMHVFYDQSIERWFIVQRSQDNDALGNPLPASHLFIAASQTIDPTANYNVYTMDTTNAQNFGCPCIFDYPQLGADENALYISGNEFNAALVFLDAAIIAISKSDLAAGAAGPAAARFIIPSSTGFEFAIQPAITPPGGSYFVANISGGGAGLEYFVSSQEQASNDARLAVWAMTNTSFINDPARIAQIGLTEGLFSTESYNIPNIATQPSGPIPLGDSVGDPLEVLDGGDLRVQSTGYVSGRLWVTLSTELLDSGGRQVIGIAYFILSPTFRSSVLNAKVLQQGYLAVDRDFLLRPAWAVNAAGAGAIVCTLSGPDHFPSTAFIPANISSTSGVQIAGEGVLPEDGFSGYPNGVARWGDTSSATVDAAGAIWLAGEYISGAPRTEFANWDTFITQYTSP